MMTKAQLQTWQDRFGTVTVPLDANPYGKMGAYYMADLITTLLNLSEWAVAGEWEALEKWEDS